MRAKDHIKCINLKKFDKERKEIEEHQRIILKREIFRKSIENMFEKKIK